MSTQTEPRPKRSFLGKIIKFLFIAFNIIMLIWVIAGVGTTVEQSNKSTNEYEKMGAEMGGSIGIMALLVLWLIGTVILGMLTYFTRPKRY